LAFASALNDYELAVHANFTIEHFGQRPGRIGAKDIELARTNYAPRQARFASSV
jgi:hypothetical protein